MSFPSTPILDDFTRANEDPLSGGGNWANAWTSQADHLKLSSNAVSSAVSSIGYSYWTQQQFGDSEGYVTATAVGGFVGVVARATPGSQLSGYRALFTAIAGTVALARLDNGTATPLASPTGSLVNGDKLGISCVGNAIRAWVFHGGVWSNILSGTDGTYSSGYLCIATNNVGVLDSFGGGSQVASTDVLLPVSVSRQFGR